MKSTRLIMLILLLMVAMTVGVAQAQTLTPTPMPGTPGTLARTAQNTLLAYYTDINLHNYQAAYNIWHDPSQSYQIFASGYSDTDHITAYFGDLQSHNVAGQLGRVPVVLLGYDFQGNIASFYGCFTLSFNYHITGATIHQLSTNGVPDQDSITHLTSIDCTHIPSSEPSATFLDTSDPSYGLMWSYFRAINQKDYKTAYADWLSPIPGPKPNGQPAEDHRQSFADFSNGYADTTWIDTYPGVFDATGASAGHGYLSGLMPIVLVGQRTDGSITAYKGCFVIGDFLNGNTGIVSGSFQPFLNDEPTAAQIIAAQKIDCTTLDLQY